MGEDDGEREVRDENEEQSKRASELSTNGVN